MSILEEIRVSYTTASISWNVKQIVTAMQKGSLVFDNVIQRSLVWNAQQKSKLIESVLLGRKIPAIFCVRTETDAPEGCKKGSKVFDCIDGKQRCNALREFKENKLVLTGVHSVLEGLTYDDLDDEDKNYFDSYSQMPVTYYMDASEREIAENMAYLNNGTALKGIDKARILANDIQGIISLANHSFFSRVLTETQMKNRSNEDILVKTLLLREGTNTDLSGKRIAEFYNTKAFTDAEIEEINAFFDDMNSVFDIIDERVENKEISKSVAKKFKSKTHLVSIFDFIRNVNATKTIIVDFLADFFDGEPTKSADYNEASTNGVCQASNVLARQEELMSAWENYISEKE